MSTTDDIARVGKLTPGSSQTRSKAPGSLGPCPPYPFRAIKLNGFMLHLENGRCVRDFTGSLASVALGGANAYVNSAVVRALSAGPSLSLPHYFEETVAMHFADHGYESTRFVLTGSEAVSGAVTLARLHTSRDRVVVLKGSYHGWHSWFQAGEGRLDALYQECQVLRKIPVNVGSYLDPKNPYYIDWSIVAALVIEPPRFQAVDEGWLMGLVDTARAQGTVVIFDEMVYGFRWALMGGAEFFHVRPDLATFGKAMGNGVPIAAITGRRDIMQHATEVSSTHGGNLLGLAAAHAVFVFYNEHDVCQHLRLLGEVFRDAFETRCPNSVAMMEHYPYHQRVIVPDADPKNEIHQRRDAALVMALERGYLFHQGAINFMYCMSIDDAASAGEVLADCIVRSA